LTALDVISDGDVAAEYEWEVTGAGWRTYNSSRAEARTAAAAAAAQIDVQDEDDEELKYTKRKTPDVKAGASTRVYIGGLPFKATEADVKGMFGTCGKIDMIELPMYAGGKAAGFGFITLVDVVSVAKAVEMDGKEMMSRWIKVKEVDRPAAAAQVSILCFACAGPCLYL
jgi:RNA recognition motif-containing protein